MTGKMEKARGQFERAVALAPDEAFYHFKLGDFHMRTAGFEAAAEEYGAAVECAPVDDFYCARLGAAYVRQERFGDAIAALRRAARIAPENPIYRYAVADVLLLAGDTETAETEYHAAGRLSEYWADGLRRWRERSGVQPLSEAGLVRAPIPEQRWM